MTDDISILEVNKLLLEFKKELQAVCDKLETIEDEFLRTLEAEGESKRAESLVQRYDLAADYIRGFMNPLEDLIRRASQLLEHGATTASTQIELSIRIAGLRAMRDMARTYAKRRLDY